MLPMPSEHEATLREVGTAPGNNGGRRLTIERVGPTWFSRFKTIHYDTQGDPRWFINVVGPEAARFFGFEMLSDSLMTVPDQAEFNGAIELVNEELEKMDLEKIGVTFYQSEQDLAKLRTYVAKYVGRKGRHGLPTGKTFNHRTHDWSFHGPSIVLTNDILDYGALRADYEDQFLDFFEAHLEETEENAERYYAQRLSLNTTSNIDVAMAQLGFSLNFFHGYSTPLALAPAKLIGSIYGVDRSIAFFTGAGMEYDEIIENGGGFDNLNLHGIIPTPRQSLKETIKRELSFESIDPKVRASRTPVKDVAHWEKVKSKLQRYNQVLDPQRVISLVDEFTDHSYHSDDPTFNPDRPYSFSILRVFSKITSKRESIHRAVLRINNRRAAELPQKSR